MSNFELSFQNYSLAKKVEKRGRERSTQAVTNQDLEELTESMLKNAALHYTNLIDKLKMARNNRPDEDLSDENDQIMDYTNMNSLFYYLTSNNCF